MPFVVWNLLYGLKKENINIKGKANLTQKGQSKEEREWEREMQYKYLNHKDNKEAQTNLSTLREFISFIIWRL